MKESQEPVAAEILENEELPKTWASLALQIGVDPSALSHAARQTLAARGSEVPGRMPGPRALGPEFVLEITKTVKKAKISIAPYAPRVGVMITVERAKIVREHIDKAIELLGVGNGVIEHVADTLGLSIHAVQKVFKERAAALAFERKLADQERERDAMLQRRAQMAEESRGERKLDAKERARPHVPPPAHIIAPAPAKEPERPAQMPEEREDNELDTFLRAAWIADRAGVPNARADAVKTLVARFQGKISAAEAEEAIVASYARRPESGRKQMERRAEKLRRDMNP